MRVVPVEVHDRINDLEYLLEGILMMAAGIGDHDQVNAIQRIVTIAKKEILEIETALEELDAPYRMTGGSA